MTSRRPLATRESDERILRWLEQADAGVQLKQIGREWGVSHATISKTLKRVREADAEAHRSQP